MKKLLLIAFAMGASVPVVAVGVMSDEAAAEYGKKLKYEAKHPRRHNPLERQNVESKREKQERLDGARQKRAEDRARRAELAAQRAEEKGKIVNKKSYGSNYCDVQAQGSPCTTTIGIGKNMTNVLGICDRGHCLATSSSGKHLL